MLSRWPIKYKLLLGAGLLLLTVGLLAFSGLSGVYSYRQLVREISQRADELPAVTNLNSSIDQLTPTLRARQAPVEFPFADPLSLTFNSEESLESSLRLQLADVHQRLHHYKRLLGEESISLRGIAGNQQEREIVAALERKLNELVDASRGHHWLRDPIQLEQTSRLVEDLQTLAHELPALMQDRMYSMHGEVRLAYRTWIVMSWVTTVLACCILACLLAMFELWIFRPLRVLVNGSREVARGNFNHRIGLKTKDEMSELARAMNDMTLRFREIRDDLDRQVRERTREVVQSERLASVGFLAAGVAHEINNPLAAIAMSAESLEPRIHRLLSGDVDEAQRDVQQEIVHKYLTRIQEESFRCKGITERLLDFSRLGSVEPEATDLRALVESVIDMLRDLGKYRGKQVVFDCSRPVRAWVNGQEIKQVVLNLITNALDSVDAEGRVRVDLRPHPDCAELIVEDNGCGMTDEVQKHLFEPFFTRRRDGQGTGLGLSITYRIVTDHGGRIEASSDGPGRGSQLKVTLPVRPDHEQAEKTSEPRRLAPAA